MCSYRLTIVSTTLSLPQVTLSHKETGEGAKRARRWGKKRRERMCGSVAGFAVLWYWLNQAII